MNKTPAVVPLTLQRNWLSVDCYTMDGSDVEYASVGYT
jgi:hypothetical protein